MLRHATVWKKVLVAVVVSEVAVIVADLVLVTLFGPQLRSFATYIFGGNDKETLSNILFIEGALVFGVGALYSSGVLENATAARARTHPVVLDKYVEQSQEMRKQQNVLGKILMLVGGPLIILSVAAYLIT